MIGEPGRIVVATYNVLADAYAHPKFYPHIDPLILAKENRYPRIVKYISGLRDIDVICLQEVEYELFAQIDFRLRRLGYRGRWAHKGGGRPDGPATFIHKSWKIDDVRIIEYADEYVEGERSGCVALMTTLKKDNEFVLVVNTHLRWDDPDTVFEKQFGFAQAVELRVAIGNRSEHSIVCGDFNAETESGVMEIFRAAGFIDAHHSSVATTNIGDRAKKIDYILAGAMFSPLPFPATPVADETPLPSDTDPSDHIMLVASLAYGTKH